MRVAVIGGGAFGTALGSHAAASGHETRLWVRRAELAREINTSHTNRDYLGETPLAASLRATADVGEATSGAELVILAVPSHTLRAQLAAMKIPEGAIVVCAAKGIESDTLKLIPEIIADFYRGPTAYVSGPSFALEVARGEPTSVVVASTDDPVARQVQSALSHGAFRCYRTPDVTGVEVGGALKNVYAIATGAAEGMGLGHNARAAIITRGLNEIALLGLALGAHPLTFAGLAGVGDLVLTCTGELSRNRRVGVELARGATLANVLGTRTVAEGVRTAKAAHALAERHHVEMPILRQVFRVLYQGAGVREALTELSQRDLKPEWPEDLHPLTTRAAKR
jgi:glycerol-3-phosphate dehydrogenase (NAD(P)+)